MTYPKLKPCPNCGCIYTELYGYGDWGVTWHVECDECGYLGPGGNKLQAIREHNARFEQKNPSFALAPIEAFGRDGETRLDPEGAKAGLAPKSTGRR